MAYQPKSYRKFLTTSVTAALVATVAAPAIPSVSAASNFNDEIPTWALDAVDYLVGKGAIEGKPGNIFDPHGSLTRGEAAKILALTLGLEVDEDAKTDFADAKDHWASRYIAAIQEQLPGVIDGYTDNTFRPNNTITRQELAKMVVEAYELEKDENVDVSFSDNNGWGKEYVEVLASLGIVQGKRANIFAPNDRVTRAETAVFVHRTEVPSARVTPEETVLRITEVKALDDANRFLQISFSQRVHSLEPADITIENAKSKERYGVKEVNLSSNGLVAQVELYSHEGRDYVLEYLTDYNVIVKANGRTLEYVFNRPAFLEQRVLSYDASDKEVTLWNSVGGTITLKVTDKVKDFDFQSVLGEKISVWYNKDNEVVDFAIAEQTAKYDAVEIKDNDEIKLISEGKEYDLTKERFVAGDTRTPIKVAFYLNGERVNLTDGKLPEEYVGKKYNFAKVGFDKSGNVEYISAYNLKDFLIVKEVEGNVVVGYEGEGTGGEFNAKDATIIKDNKIISLDDIEEGDVLFYNKDANNGDGFAEVLSNTVSGEIDEVFQNAVRVNGKTYRFADDEDVANFDVNYAAGAVYLNEDGETEYVDSDAAEELQAAGPVTLYFDRAGNLVYIAGELADVVRNKVVSILTADIIGYKQARDRIEVEAKFSTGEEKLFDMNLKDLKSIIIDGKEYEIDNDSNRKWSANLDGQTIVLTKSGEQTQRINLNNTKENVVKLHLNDDRNRIEKLEFYKNRAIEVNETIEIDDKYVSGKRLTSSTIVFDAKSFTNDAKDIKVTTWGEYKGSDISKATIVYDKDDQVVAIVIKETTASDVVYEEALLTEVLRNKDGEIVEITAFVNGEKKTFEVDEVVANVQRGHVAILKFDDKNKDLVHDIILPNDYASNYAFVADIEKGNVNVGKREVTINGTVYRLANNGLVIDNRDKSDIKTKSLTDIDGRSNVTVVLDEKDSRFVKFFIYGDTNISAPAPGDNDNQQPQDPDAKITFSVSKNDWLDANLGGIGVYDIEGTIAGEDADKVSSVKIEIVEGLQLDANYDADTKTFTFNTAQVLDKNSKKVTVIALDENGEELGRQTININIVNN